MRHREAEDTEDTESGTKKMSSVFVLGALCVSVSHSSVPRIIAAAMAAKIIDGNAIAQQVKDDVKRRVAELSAQHHRVHLSAILVGGTPAGEMYAQRQAESCAAVGIDYNLL